LTLPPALGKYLTALNGKCTACMRHFLHQKVSK